jgi:hypothetical protein
VLTIVAAGLTAGAIHVLSGPDHLAAVAPLAADSRRSKWKTGFTWGVGHTSGVLVVGALALLLREVLPIDAISSWSERLVGVALVGVGLWGLRQASRMRVHQHAHSHDGSTHVHVHVHVGEHATAAGPVRAAATVDHTSAPHDHTHASFAFGILHGLAGSSHVIGILPALALPTRAMSAAYLASYGIGNIASMTLFSSALGVVAGRARHGGLPAYRALLYACSVLALLVGGVWLTT